MNVTVTSTKLILSDAGFNLVFNGQDLIRATPTTPRTPLVQSGPYQGQVSLTLTGAAREALGVEYIIPLEQVENQPTWLGGQSGAVQAASDISVMIRSVSGGGGGQVDTIVPGDAIDVDSTDPANPTVNVKVDGVTIGFNGSNELEVPAGGGGYVPTTRTISTTAPLTGGGDLSANRTIGIPQANGATDGFLDSADWTTFNNKGDVSGPGSSTDNNIALFDGITGKLIKDSGYTPGQIVIPTGFGDIDLIETSPGFWPVEIKGGLDGDGTTMQSNTGSFQVNVNPKNSIEVDAAQVQLVGDEASPGNSEYYGTNGAGTKGFYPLPTDTGITQLTGDVTAGPGSGSQAATIANGAVTFAKMQAVSANILLGNDAAGTAVEEIACTSAGRALLDDATAADQRTTLGVLDGVAGTEAAYTGTINFTAGTDPSGATNLRQYYTQVGNLVTFFISLTYATPGVGVTNITLTFPTEFPVPDIPTGLAVASARIYPLIGRANTTLTGTPIAITPIIARNAGDTAFEIIHSAFTSGAYRAFMLQGSYFTS